MQHADSLAYVRITSGHSISISISISGTAFSREEFNMRTPDCVSGRPVRTRSTASGEISTSSSQKSLIWSDRDPHTIGPFYLSEHYKLHIHRFSSFCGAHGRDQQTDTPIMLGSILPIRSLCGGAARFGCVRLMYRFIGALSAL